MRKIKIVEIDPFNEGIATWQGPLSHPLLKLRVKIDPFIEGIAINKDFYV